MSPPVYNYNYIIIMKTVFILVFVTFFSSFVECHSNHKHHSKHKAVHAKDVLPNPSLDKFNNFLVDLSLPLLKGERQHKESRSKLHNLKKQQMAPADPTPPTASQPIASGPIAPAQSVETTGQPATTAAPVVIYASTLEPGDDESGSGFEETFESTTTASVSESPAELVTTTPALPIPAGPSVVSSPVAPVAQPEVTPPIGIQYPVTAAGSITTLSPTIITTTAPPVAMPYSSATETVPTVVRADTAAQGTIKKIMNKGNEKSHVQHNKHGGSKRKLHEKESHSKSHHQKSKSHNVNHSKKNVKPLKKGVVTTHTLNRVSQTPNASMTQHAKSDTSAIVRLTSQGKQS
ncbi:hypothetical protein MXB_2137 [Myxobolus squamalis]|nr:hypothetical protein MXB_2137 [Myxobolus squamalis]